MKNRLSHSAVNKYLECPTAWKLHYVDKLRSTTMSAALLFGTAIDKAVEVLVQSKDLNHSKLIFNNLWDKQEINGVSTELEYCPDIVYAKNDLDLEIINLDDYTDVELFNKILEKKDTVGFDNLSVDEKRLYNGVNWVIARERGELMLEAVYNEILPKLTKVLSTQEKIDLSNGDGDSVIGYVDMVAEYEGYSSPIIFDFKTSTRAYEENSVRTSPQLTLYVHALEEKYKTRKAGFIVLSKAIQKNRKKICSVCGNDGSGGRHKTCDAKITDLKGSRCNGEWKETINPKAKIDVIIDDIPEQLENIVLENFDNVEKLIDTGVYVRNLGNCIKPYGLCTFYNLCHHNKMDGLIKV